MNACQNCPYVGCEGCKYQGEVKPTGSVAARLDACPSCTTNTEVPFGAYLPPKGGIVALYKCTDCGHRWHTSWASEVAA